MIDHKAILVAAGAMLGLSAALLPAGALAVSQERSFIGNANAWCNPATPAADGAIRRRPLAVQNEGTTAAFVTCTFIVQHDSATPGSSKVDLIYINAQSSDGAAHSITCTAVTGTSRGGDEVTGGNEYVPKSAELPTDRSRRSLSWTGADFAGDPSTIPSTHISLSCVLPPGVALNDMYVRFTEDVGT